MKKTIKYFILFIFCAVLVDVNGQTASYSFDNCTFTDDNGNYADANTIFAPSCDCGLLEDGLYLDGNDDHLNFPTEIDSLMEEDFTLSLYFRIEASSVRTDILSVRSECALDSFLAVSYNPLNNNITFELAQNIGNIKTETAKLDQSRCWHRLVITKSGLIYNLYLDDVLAISIFSNGVVNFDDQSTLSISNSPCLAVNVDRFQGWIDQVQFHTRALSQIELVANSLRPDMILNNDTTIVIGAEVQIETGPTCADNFSWTPTTTLDDDSILDPVATPDMTTTYTISYQNSPNCITSDEMTINVIDPEAIDCSNILLPNAFTPNNDQLNDTYGISSLFLVEELSYFEVYDRWGAKMWSTNSKTDTWDGTFKGQPVNPGMFLYKVKYLCSGEEYVKVDNFSVLR